MCEISGETSSTVHGQDRSRACSFRKNLGKYLVQATERNTSEHTTCATQGVAIAVVPSVRTTKRGEEMGKGREKIEKEEVIEGKEAGEGEKFTVCFAYLLISFLCYRGRINWASAGVTFPLMIQLLDLDIFRYAILLGIVPNVGAATQSMVLFFCSLFCLARLLLSLPSRISSPPLSSATSCFLSPLFVFVLSLTCSL